MGEAREETLEGPAACLVFNMANLDATVSGLLKRNVKKALFWGRHIICYIYPVWFNLSCCIRVILLFTRYTHYGNLV